MSSYIPSSGVRPNDLRSDYIKTVASPNDPSVGDVYFNDNQISDEQIDYAKLPFKRGTIHLPNSQWNFYKGTYCGRHYEIAAKIDYINRHILPGDRLWCSAAWEYGQVVRFTHRGDAVHTKDDTRYLAALDEKAIQEKYKSTRRRVEPCSICCGSICCKLLSTAVLVSAVALYVFLS